MNSSNAPHVFKDESAMMHEDVVAKRGGLWHACHSSLGVYGESGSSLKYVKRGKHSQGSIVRAKVSP